MKIELRPLADITPYENNPRINDGAVDAVAASLREFGFRQPIVVDGDGVVIVGHTRLKAAMKLGLEKVPVHVAKDMTPDQIRAYRIADNKTNEYADWNFDALSGELGLLQEVGFDMASLGFEEAELEKMVNAGGTDGLTDPDEVPLPPDDPITQPGDLWVLGRHRLLCGDSGSPADLDRLLDGAVIDLVNMDPPYNVSVHSRSSTAMASGQTGGLPTPAQNEAFIKTKGAGFGNHAGKVHAKLRPKDRPLNNDFLTDDEFDDRLLGWFGNASRALKPGGSFYIWGGAFPGEAGSKANSETYAVALRHVELAFSHMIIWDKGCGVIGHKDFMTQYETCFYGWKEGAGHNFYGPNNITDVWAVKKVAQQQMVHLTEKPVELAARAIQYSSQPGENVLDLFGGSGSTLMACEQQGRRGFLMELDTQYCDVIVQRWEKFTGEKAVRHPANAAAEKKAPATAEA